MKPKLVLQLLGCSGHQTASDLVHMETLVA